MTYVFHFYIHRDARDAHDNVKAAAHAHARAISALLNAYGWQVGGITVDSELVTDYKDYPSPHLPQDQTGVNTT